MISEVIPLGEYLKIYGEIGTSKSIASILSYPDFEGKTPGSIVRLKETTLTGKRGVIGIIGAGNFTKMTMLPALKTAQATIKYIASQGGVSGTAMAQKHAIANSTSDYREILNDSDVDLVMNTTRHNLHASMTVEVLNAGKHAFVEKPLALNEGELQQVIEAYEKNNTTITVGFNRRFSPHIEKMKSVLGNSPMNVIATMNAGAIPANVWVHDLKVGGGRIIGEACHFIDLITFLTGSKVKSVCMNAMGVNPEENTDNATLLLKYENGSTGVINYFANGSKAYSKERVEVYSQERTLVMDNFRETKAYGFKGFSKLKTKLDKGHKNQFAKLVNVVENGGDPLIPFDEIVNTTRASFAAIESLKQGKWINL
jgi:predicted dehydrogenase